MALETGDFINDLVPSNPLNTDPRSQGAAHIRLLKATVQATFPNITSPINVTAAEVNYLDGLSENVQQKLNSLSTAVEQPGSMAFRDITISTSEPSGGENGDVWLQYE